MNDNEIPSVDDFWQEPEKINRSKVKKKRNRDGFLSNHRNNKTGTHSTIGGLGHVGRVYQKKGRNNGK
jgi:hypothetical protein